MSKTEKTKWNQNQAAMGSNLHPKFGHEHVEVLSRKPLHAGYIRVDELILRHRLFAGGDSDPFRRELIVRPRGVGVLLYDPERREAVLARQFRVGMIDEPRSPWMLELVAGMVDENEDPIEVARRESREESGIEPVQVVRICDYYNSPGVGNERISLFCGRVDAGSAGGIHGLDEENEDIEVVIVPYDDLVTAVEEGHINNAMTIIAVQWLQLHHEELHQLWARTA